MSDELSMQEKLDSLDEVQITKVFKLINKLVAKNQIAEATPPVKSDIHHTTTVLRERNKKSGPVSSKTKKNDDDDVVMVGRRKNIRMGKGRGRQGKAKREARTEPISISGENKFLTMSAYNEHKDDVDIDKKLSHGKKLVPRSKRHDGYLTVECSECEREKRVHESVLTSDSDYLCDDCILSRK